MEKSREPSAAGHVYIAPNVRWGMREQGRGMLGGRSMAVGFLAALRTWGWDAGCWGCRLGITSWVLPVLLFVVFFSFQFCFLF